MDERTLEERKKIAKQLGELEEITMNSFHEKFGKSASCKAPEQITKGKVNIGILKRLKHFYYLHKSVKTKQLDSKDEIEKEIQKLDAQKVALEQYKKDIVSNTEKKVINSNFEEDIKKDLIDATIKSKTLPIDQKLKEIDNAIEIYADNTPTKTTTENIDPNVIDQISEADKEVPKDEEIPKAIELEGPDLSSQGDIEQSTPIEETVETTVVSGPYFTEYQEGKQQEETQNQVKGENVANVISLLNDYSNLTKGMVSDLSKTISQVMSKNEQLRKNLESANSKMVELQQQLDIEKQQNDYLSEQLDVYKQNVNGLATSSSQESWEELPVFGRQETAVDRQELDPWKTLPGFGMVDDTPSMKK